MHSKLAAFYLKHRALLFGILCSTLLIPIKWSSIAIVLFTILFLVSVPFKDMKANWKENSYPLLLFLFIFVLNALSLLYSDDLKHGLKDVESKLSLVLFPLIWFGQGSVSAKEKIRALLIFASSTFIACLLALTFVFIQSGSIVANQELAGIIGMHASYLSLYVAFSFFIFLKCYRETSKWFLLPILAFLFVLLVFLAARIVLLGFVLSILIWFLIRQFSLKRMLYAFLGLSIMGGIAYAYEPVKLRFVEAISFDERIPLDIEQTPENELMGPYGGRAIRIAIWDCASDVAQENFLLGVGTGDVHKELQNSYRKRRFYFAWLHNNYNAHNLWLESIIAFGFFGLLALLLIFYRLFFQAFRRQDMLLFAFAMLFFSLSFMESTFNVHRGLVFFAALSPFLLNQELDKKKGETEASPD